MSDTHDGNVWAGVRRAAFRALLGLPLWGLLACDSPPARFEAVHRLVPRDAPDHDARETIGDETRRVLGVHPPVSLVYGLALAEGVGRFSRALPMPPPLDVAQRVLLESRLREGARIRPLVGRVARVEHGPRPQAVIDLSLPEPAGPGERTLFLRARPLPPGPEHVLQTAGVEVPRGARLEFATGVLASGPEQGAVHFRVEVCGSADCQEIFAIARDPAEAGGRAWRDHRVSLADHVGRHRSFRFTSRVDAPDGYSLGVFAHPTVYAATARERPSFIVVSMDTLGAKHLPLHGYGRDTAPFLSDELAPRGVVFDHAVSAATTTGPSHMTLFTSLTPSVHGVRGNTGARPLPRAAPTLAERLHDAGFATGAVTENAAIALGRGFERGFDFYRENKSSDGERTGGHVAATLGAGLAWIERHRDRPFFLFLHSYEVHTPYRPPEAYAELFREPLPGEPSGLPRAWRPERYDREIRYVDDQLRSFVEQLDRAGVLRDTFLVFTSDHGEAFGEHGFLAHGVEVHEEVLRVPLIVVGPGVPGGRRTSEPVGLIDLLPTVLELAGLPPLPGAMGRSFADYLRGRGPLPAPAPIFSEAWRTTGYTRRGAVEIQQPTFVVRRGSWKLIRYRDGDGFRYELFDLARDPLERDDRQGEAGAPIAELQALIEEYGGVADELRRALETRDDGRRNPALMPDAEREEKLRALGYIQ